VGCSSVCWNPSIFDPQTLVVGCYFDNKKNNSSDLVQVFAYIDSKKEYQHIFSFDDGHSDTVTDVEWAPQFGRSFHLIATCSLDKTVMIWKVDINYDVINQHFENLSIKKEKLKTIKCKSQVINL